MRLSKVRRRCGCAAYSVFRMKSMEPATLYWAGFHSNSRKVVRYQRSDCSLFVSKARSVRCLSDILLAFSLPNLPSHSSMKASCFWRLAASGMLRLAAPSYLPTEIALSGSRRHRAVRNWPLRLFMERSLLFSLATAATVAAVAAVATAAFLATFFFLLLLVLALPFFCGFLAALAGVRVKASINAASATLFLVSIVYLLNILLFVLIRK